MNKAMIEFYNEKNILISEAVKRGMKQQLTEAQTLEGLETVYNRIQDGEQIKDVSLIWEAWEAARRSQGKEYMQWCKSRDEYMAEIKRLNGYITNYQGAFFGMATLLLSIIILFGYITHV